VAATSENAGSAEVAGVGGMAANERRLIGPSDEIKEVKELVFRFKAASSIAGVNED
jgi:hypothetical protein